MTPKLFTWTNTHIFTYLNSHTHLVYLFPTDYTMAFRSVHVNCNNLQYCLHVTWQSNDPNPTTAFCVFIFPLFVDRNGTVSVCVLCPFINLSLVKRFKPFVGKNSFYYSYVNSGCDRVTGVSVERACLHASCCRDLDAKQTSTMLMDLAWPSFQLSAEQINKQIKRLLGSRSKATAVIPCVQTRNLAKNFSHVIISKAF